MHNETFNDGIWIIFLPLGKLYFMARIMYLYKYKKIRINKRPKTGYWICYKTLSNKKLWKENPKKKLIKIENIRKNKALNFNFFKTLVYNFMLVRVHVAWAIHFFLYSQCNMKMLFLLLLLFSLFAKYMFYLCLVTFRHVFKYKSHPYIRIKLYLLICNCIWWRRWQKRLEKTHLHMSATTHNNQQQIFMYFCEEKCFCA